MPDPAENKINHTLPNLNFISKWGEIKRGGSVYFIFYYFILGCHSYLQAVI